MVDFNEVLSTEVKRRRYAKNALIDILKDEYIIIDVLFDRQADHLSSMLEYHQEPQYHREIPKLVKEYASRYRHSVREWNIAAFGKPQVSPRDVLGAEYDPSKHPKMIEREKEDENLANDNGEICITSS